MPPFVSNPTELNEKETYIPIEVPVQLDMNTVGCLMDESLTFIMKGMLGLIEIFGVITLIPLVNLYI